MDPALEAEILIVVLEKPKGVYAQEFAGLFHKTHGYQLILSKHGYTSLKSLLNDMKDLVELIDTPNGPMIKCISPKEHNVLHFKGNNTPQQNNHAAPNSSRNDQAAASGVINGKSETSLDTFEVVMLTCEEREVDKNSIQGLQKVKSTPQNSIKQQPSVNSKTAEVNKVAFGLSKDKNTVTHDKFKTEQCSMDKTSHNSANGLNVENKLEQKSDQCNLPTVSITEIIPQMLCEYKDGIKRNTLQKRFNKKYNISLEKLSKHLGHKNMHCMIKKIPGINVNNTNGHLKYILKQYVAPKAQASNTNTASKTQMPAPTFDSAIQTGKCTDGEALSKGANGPNVEKKPDECNIPSVNITEIIPEILNKLMAGIKSNTLERLFKEKHNISLEKLSKDLGYKDMHQMIKKIPGIEVIKSKKHLRYILKKYVAPTNPKPQVPNMNSASKTQMPAPIFDSAIQTGKCTDDEALCKGANGANVEKKPDECNIPSVNITEIIPQILNGLMAGIKSNTLEKLFKEKHNISLEKLSKDLGYEDMHQMIKKIPGIEVIKSKKHLKYILKQYVAPTNPKPQVPNINSARETQMPAPTSTSAIQTKESQQPERNNSVMSTDQVANKSETIRIPSNHILADSEVIAESEKSRALKNASQMATLEWPVTSTEVMKTPSKPTLVVSKVNTSTAGKCTEYEALCKDPTNPKAQVPNTNSARETQMPAPTFNSAIQTKESQQPEDNNFVTTSSKATTAHKAYIPPANGAVVRKIPAISKPLSVEIKKTPSKPILVNKKVNTSSTDVKVQKDPAQYVPTAPKNGPHLINQNNQIFLNSQIMPQFNKGLLPHTTYAQACKVFLPANGGGQTQHTVLPLESIDKSQTKPHHAKKESPPAMSNMEIKKNIKCILEIHAEGITIFNLQKCYIFKFKHPLLSSGFSSMKQFLMTLKDVASVEGLGVQALVFPVSSDEFSPSSNNVFTEKSNHPTSKKYILEDGSSFLRTPKKEILHFAPSGVPTASSLLPTENPNGKELLPIPYISFGSYMPGDHLLKGPSPINPSFKPVATTEKKTKKDSMSNHNVDGIMHKPDETEWPSLSTSHRLLRQLIQNNTSHVNRQSESVHSLQNVADALIEKVDEPEGPPSKSNEKPAHSHIVKTVHPTVSDSSKTPIPLPNSQTTTTTGRMGLLPSEQTLSNISVPEKATHRTEPPKLFSADKIHERIPQTVSRDPQSLPLPSPEKSHNSNSKQANTKSPSTEADGQAKQEVKQFPGKERTTFAVDTSRQNGEHTSDVQDELHQPSDSVSQCHSVAQKAETWQTTEDYCCIL